MGKLTTKLPVIVAAGRRIIFAPMTSPSADEHFMHRCLELAALGAGYTAPNPLVGAVIVYNGRIIGEGYHQHYGEPHAEVNAVKDAIRNGGGGLLPQSTIYVSLEPCAHFGKTPPCADLIIHHKIPRVMIGCRDPFPAVNGKGIEKLEAAGIAVETGILGQQCVDINRRFFTFHTEKRPYILLKWAQTIDGRMASGSNNRLLISNTYSNRLVHRWRSEEAAILIGSATALADDPHLTTRLWPGNSPVRLVLDRDLQLPSRLHLFDQSVRTIVFNSIKDDENGATRYIRLENPGNPIPGLLSHLHALNIQSVMIEGGPTLLQHFISAGYWDEARVIENRHLHAGDGLAAPVLPGALLQKEWQLQDDIIRFYRRSAKS